MKKIVILSISFAVLAAGLVLGYIEYNKTTMTAFLWPISKFWHMPRTGTAEKGVIPAAEEIPVAAVVVAAAMNIIKGNPEQIGKHTQSHVWHMDRRRAQDRGITIVLSEYMYLLPAEVLEEADRA